MKFSTVILALSVAFGAVLAAPNPNAEAEALADADPEASFDLDKRACTPLSRQQCYAASSTTRSGVYCGWCLQVLGSHWESHRNWAYQLNAQTGACCTYGFRRSCNTENGDAQCPI